MASLHSQRAGVASTSSRSQQQVPGAVCLGSSFMGAPATRVVSRKSVSAAAARSRRSVKVQAVIEAPSVRYEPATRAKTSSVLSIILGGGAGTRLFPLTKSRAKPAVPIGGAYRLIDVPMSNCINSGISKIYILTQFNSTSLNRHLARAYNMGSGVRFGGDGFVEVLAATQTPTTGEWFQGTADAVRQYSWLLDDTKNRSIEDVVILSGDHLYRMDYMKFVNYHRDTNADITIGAIPYSADRAKEFGLMKIDDKRRVKSFAEKPKTAEALAAMRVDTSVLGLTPEEAEAKPYLASMGIYVFKRKVLLELLKETFPGANDFGGEIIPQAAERGLNVMAYPFYGYWEDIGTIKSFFEENLKLCRHPASFEFYDPLSPIYTSPRVLPPATVQNSKVVDAIISQGSFVNDSTITNAVIGIRSIINKNVNIQDALVFGADFYESDEERAAATPARPAIGIGENSVITNAIIEKNCRIGKNVKIMNKEGISEATRSEEGIYIRSGIVVIDKNSIIPDGMVI